MSLITFINELLIAITPSKIRQKQYNILFKSEIKCMNINKNVHFTNICSVFYEKIKLL